MISFRFRSLRRCHPDQVQRVTTAAKLTSPRWYLSPSTRAPRGTNYQRMVRLIRAGVKGMISMIMGKAVEILWFWGDSTEPEKILRER